MVLRAIALNSGILIRDSETWDQILCARLIIKNNQPKYIMDTVPNIPHEINDIDVHHTLELEEYHVEYIIKNGVIRALCDMKHSTIFYTVYVDIEKRLYRVTTYSDVVGKILCSYSNRFDNTPYGVQIDSHNQFTIINSKESVTRISLPNVKRHSFSYDNQEITKIDIDIDGIEQDYLYQTNLTNLTDIIVEKLNVYLTFKHDIDDVKYCYCDIRELKEYLSNLQWKIIN